ncbi:hypothetical protein FGO68_gene2980 [Halteria grandinella]|uniref:Kinesin-like protein n=1 Tax=Halteria grandinella TaxID=5974 RepID=A0A8J8P276_HALGN|nr:hypothetical protein FGO68_gene2980 [Halteria grandinella]
MSTQNRQSDVIEQMASTFGFGPNEEDTQAMQKIKVAVRVRPLMPHEMQSKDNGSRLVADVSRASIKVLGDNGQNCRAFQFDQVFDETSRQLDVYKGLGVDQMVAKVVEGYHATIFAYGQTGSGKTFTMEGMANSVSSREQEASAKLGISQRAIVDLFKRVKKIRESPSHSKHINVFCSFLQIYNERVYDLLNPDSTPDQLRGQLDHTDYPAKDEGRLHHPQGLRIRWTKKEQFIVENLFVFECGTADDALELFQEGLRNKVVASHNLNHQSSRSHCIFTLTVETVDPSNLDTTVTSKLQLVDLAGSEKIAPTTSTMAKESIDINKSLFVLRKVINKLSELSSTPEIKKGAALNHVPYRDSKLTSLLKHSLGGNSYCLMIACISPAERYLDGPNGQGSGETISTLQYATRAACIQNQPTKNVDPKIKIITQLQAKVDRLQKELKNANDHIAFLTQQAREPLTQPSLSKAQSQLILHQSLASTPLSNPRRHITSSHNSAISSDSQNFMHSKLSIYKEQISQANERLIDSVTKVTELLRANQYLREEVDILSRGLEDKDYEVYGLNGENGRLRERIEVLETIVMATVRDNGQQVEEAIALNQLKEQSPQRNNGPIGKVYHELMHLRQSNRVLENRIKTLEKQNIEISKSLDFVGNNEPTRPMMLQNGPPQTQINRRKQVRYSEDNSMQFSPSDGDLIFSNNSRIVESSPPPASSVSRVSQQYNPISAIKSQRQLNPHQKSVQNAAQNLLLSKMPSVQVLKCTDTATTVMSTGGDRKRRFLQRLAKDYTYFHQGATTDDVTTGAQMVRRGSSSGNPNKFHGLNQDNIVLAEGSQKRSAAVPMVIQGNNQHSSNNLLSNLSISKSRGSRVEISNIGSQMINMANVVIRKKSQKKKRGSKNQ